MSIADEVAKLEQRLLRGEISQTRFEADVSRLVTGRRGGFRVDSEAEITTDAIPRVEYDRGVPDPFGGVPPKLRSSADPEPATQEPSGPGRRGEPVPSRLGAYKLVELVGQGGMGLVYAAKHLVRPGLYAVKVPRPHLAADPAFVRRFRREARVGLKLDHPGIVKVHDLIIDGEYPAIVMDFVSGANLDTLIRNTGGPLGSSRILDIFGQVLDAIAYAHHQGCVHSDLKPKNVLVRMDGRTLVTDFGLARLTKSEASQSEGLFGTAQYLAPEVYATGAKPDARSDIYALGMTLYKMLVGRLPFEPGASAYAILRVKEAGDVPPPSRFQPALPPAVDALVLRALAPDPAARFGSCEAFAASLKQVLGGLQAQPTQPLPPSLDGGKTLPLMPAVHRSGLQAEATVPFTPGPVVPHPADDELAATLDGIPSVSQGAASATDETLDGEETPAGPTHLSRFVAPTIEAPAVGRQKVAAPEPAITTRGRRLIAALAALLLVAVGANIYLLLNEESRGIGGRFLRGDGDAFGDALSAAESRAQAEAGLSEDLPEARRPAPPPSDGPDVDWSDSAAPGEGMPTLDRDDGDSELRTGAADLTAVAARKAVTRRLGTLHLTSTPVSEVEIDGVAYGTTEVTRTGIPLPEGTHVVRFRCSSEECAGFKRRGAKKTVNIEADRTLRFHADFVELNKPRGATPSPTPGFAEPTPAQPQ